LRSSYGISVDDPINHDLEPQLVLRAEDPRHGKHFRDLITVSFDQHLPVLALFLWGTKKIQFGLWSCKSREAAIQADQYPREYQYAWFVETLQAGEVEVYLSRKFRKITRATQQTGHNTAFRTMSTDRGST